MARSIKKGPFVDDHLAKKVFVLNQESKKKRSSKPGQEDLPLFLTLLVIHLLFTMVKNSFQFMSPKIWLDIN